MNTVARIQRITLLSALLLTACAGNQLVTPGESRPVLVFDDSLFGEKPEIVDTGAIFALTDSQRHDFLAYFNDRSRARVPAHARVRDYLKLVTEGFDFHNDTRTAADALDKAEGNCLSLAILTTALANLVDVDVGYQLVDSTPVFNLSGNLATKGVHVRSRLYDPSWRSRDKFTLSFFRQGIQIDYFPDGTERFVSNLSKSEYVAMYYSNIGGEAVITGDIEFAYWSLLESLKVEPDNSLALNTMAVVYRRAGDEETAELIYKYGIDYVPGKVSFLRNYRTLLRAQGRSEEAESITDVLATMEDPNPIDWISAGRKAYADGELKDAISFYKKAIKIAPYLHEAYFGMALAYFELGDASRGEKALRQALDNAQRQTTRSLYQAKLMALSDGS